jgi:hypothetical protein
VVAALAAGLLAPALSGCGRIGLNDVVPKDAAVDAVVPDDAVDAIVIDPCALTYTTMIGQSYYRFSGTPTSWDIAEHACEADGRGTHLVVFNDSLEMNKVEEMVQGTPLWVGLTDRVSDGNFLDVMNQRLQDLFLLGWETGDPAFAGAGCVKFTPSSRLFHDQDCATQVAYVCECDGVLAEPSSF